MRRILLALTLLLSLPAGASAATGSTTLDLGGTAYQSLRAKGVKLVANTPARLARGTLRLPVRQAVVGSVALLNQGGTVRLRARRRAVALERLQVRLGPTSRVNATVRGRRLALFAIAGTGSLDATAGSASLRAGRLSLTRAGARAIRRALRLGRVRAGRFGTITVDALAGGGPTQPGPDRPGADPPGGGRPESPPITDEPPVLARPAGAVDVSAATVTWHIRDSWVRYSSTEQDNQPLGGATPDPAIPQDQHPCPDAPAAAAPPPLVYSYTVPLANGWHDAASGQTALYARGGVGFRFPGHGINLDVLDLEVELNGATSRLIARFDGRGNTDPGNKRAVLANLTGTAPARGGPPATLKGTIPTGGSESVFAGFYSAGDGFGCVTVSYTP